MSIDIPVSKTTLTLGYDQGTTLNQEFGTEDKILYNNNIQKLWYLTSIGYFNWKIPTGLKVEALDELTYTPGVSVSTNYSKLDIPDTTGTWINPSQSFGFSKIDWMENYRKGFILMAGNGNSYSIDNKIWSHNISFDGQAHITIVDKIGMSFRLYGLHWFTGALTKDDRAARTVSYLLRGIDDKLIGADSVLAFNFDFAYSLFKFMPSDWLNKHKLRYFNFEFQLGPFVDLALVDGQEYDSNSKFIDKVNFTPKNLLVTTGFQAIIFPLTFRSVFLRFSMGWNLTRSMKDDFGHYEFSLGIGHFY
jgi:hypothetical protein